MGAVPADETAATRMDSPTTATIRQTDPPPAVAPLRVGELVGASYRIVRHLARGGFGEVYEAEDERTGTTLALKLQRTQGKDAGTLEALRGEFALLATLRHPNLATVHDFGYLGRAAYFTQDYVRGRQLDRAEVDLSTPRGVALVGQLARALDYLHARGILHRDVKPSNVMVESETDRLVLLDFGVARALAHHNEEGFLTGSYAYMAPETITGQPLDPRSDLYSLGVTLYRIAANRLPFEVKGREAAEILLDHVHAEPPPLPPSVPRAIADVILRLLAKEPGGRFASAGELLQSFALAVGVEIATETPETLASYVLSARFVDRLGVLSRLEGAIDRRAPTPLIALEGEAGTGKSRTLRELRHGLLLRGIPWVAVQTHAERAETLLRDLAEAIIDPVVEATLSEEDRLELARGVLHLKRPRERIAVPLDPERARTVRIEALGRAAAARFGEGPGVVCVEDFHRATGAAVADLAAFIEAATRAEARCAVLVTARPGEALRLLGERAPVERHEARALDAAGCRALVASMLGGPDVLAGTRLGHTLSSGEHAALWVQESLRLALDRGALARRAGAWSVLEDVIPLPLEEVLTWRLLSLPTEARALALAASVFGEPATVAELARVAGKAVPDAARAVAELVRAGIAEERSGGARGTSYEMHDRYRDVAPSLLSVADARRAHAGAARLLLQKKDDARRLARAATHLERAGHQRAAARCLGEASRVAERGGRPDVALVLLDAAERLEVAPRIRDLLRRHDLARSAANAGAATSSLAAMIAQEATATPAEHVEIALRRIGRAAQEGRVGLVRSLAAGAVEQATALGSMPLFVRAKIVEGDAEQILGSFDRAGAAFAAAAQVARQLGARTEEATASMGASFAELHLGRPTLAIEAARRAVRAAGSANLSLRADALRQLGNVLRETERNGQAAASYRRSVAAARRAGCLEREAKALNNLGTVALRLGDVQQAIVAYERSIALKRRAGARASVLLGLNNLGALYLATGAFGEAKAMFEQVLADESVAALAVVCAVHANLADLALFARREDEAVQRYERAVEACRERSLVVEIPHVLSGLTRALLQRRRPGDLEEAGRRTEELVKVATQISTPVAQRRLFTAKAVLADAHGERESALAAARQAVAVVESVTFYDVIATPLEARWILAIALSRAGKHRAAQRAVTSAQRTLLRLAERFRDPGRRASFLTSSPIHVAVSEGSLDLRPGTTWSAPRAEPR